MNVKEEKCVIVVDEGMELGVIANVTAILSISLMRINSRKIWGYRKKE